MYSREAPHHLDSQERPSTGSPGLTKCTALWPHELIPGTHNLRPSRVTQGRKEGKAVDARMTNGFSLLAPHKHPWAAPGRVREPPLAPGVPAPRARAPVPPRRELRCFPGSQSPGATWPSVPGSCANSPPPGQQEEAATCRCHLQRRSLRGQAGQDRAGRFSLTGDRRSTWGHRGDDRSASFQRCSPVYPRPDSWTPVLARPP